MRTRRPIIGPSWQSFTPGPSPPPGTPQRTKSLSTLLNSPSVPSINDRLWSSVYSSRSPRPASPRRTARVTDRRPWIWWLMRSKCSRRMLPPASGQLGQACRPGPAAASDCSSRIRVVVASSVSARAWRSRGRADVGRQLVDRGDEGRDLVGVVGEAADDVGQVRQQRADVGPLATEALGPLLEEGGDLGRAERGEHVGAGGHHVLEVGDDLAALDHGAVLQQGRVRLVGHRPQLDELLAEGAGAPEPGLHGGRDAGVGVEGQLQRGGRPRLVEVDAAHVADADVGHEHRGPRRQVGDVLEGRGGVELVLARRRSASSRRGRAPRAGRRRADDETGEPSVRAHPPTPRGSSSRGSSGSSRTAPGSKLWRSMRSRTSDRRAGSTRPRRRSCSGESWLRPCSCCGLSGRQGVEQAGVELAEGAQLLAVEQAEDQVQSLGQVARQVRQLRGLGRLRRLRGREAGRRGRRLAGRRHVRRAGDLEQRVPEGAGRRGAARLGQRRAQRRAGEAHDQATAQAGQAVPQAGLVEVGGQPRLGLVVERQDVALGVVGQSGRRRTGGASRR